MALDLTTNQRNLLRSPNPKARILSTWYMDSGTYRYCDDVDDITMDGETWIGAAALASVTEIKSGNGMAAEPVTINIDGTRMYQAGYEDPAGLFREILEELLPNRVVDLELALGYQNESAYILRIPLFSGKINHARMIDPTMKPTGDDIPQPRLEIKLDSLAMRYNWVTGRVRNHQDQLAIDPTDMFFSLTHNNIRNEQLLFWGKKAPVRASYGGGGGGLGGGGGGNTHYDSPQDFSGLTGRFIS